MLVYILTLIMLVTRPTKNIYLDKYFSLTMVFVYSKHIQMEKSNQFPPIYMNTQGKIQLWLPYFI